jgi:hypothetical protein
MQYLFIGALPLMLLLVLLPHRHHTTTEAEKPVKEMLLKNAEQQKNTEGNAILYQKNILVNIL